jgi:hypothetical protein
VTEGRILDYNLETLGDERFQKFCQALLTAKFPNVQCLPIGQPDGGRDALVRLEGGFIVFQVKYSRDPSSKDERLAISEVIKSEQSKVKKLILAGATSYYLMTNVSGTAHLEVGSIDRVNEELTAAFGIPSYCWWRDDLERRLETTEGLLWRYPEIFRGSDFLELLSVRSSKIPRAKTSTFRAYVSTQYSKESEVRFQQVQLQNSLLDLFTDTPIGIARDKIPKADISRVPNSLLSAALDYHRRQYHYVNDEDGDLLAADWLLTIAPEEGLQRVVLEGAPGQGKSTVTQYLAQLNRMRSLRKAADAEKVPQKHLAHTLRLPLRVDLRDYASWLAGIDPFAADRDVARPDTAADGLESFLAHQIKTLSGGRPFDVDDLLSTIEESHCLLILDGFDEVADKPTRTRLREQIREAAERLGTDCKSIQMIVTSRPAAFILSPGFPEREWLHLRLLPMQKAQISEYSEKWVVARDFPPREGLEFKELLLDRLERPHIRSLAQNPMQLAILLTLISTKGLSLPDKRTALYDSYMDLFFGREAEKDATVRENRDVLIQIHQYVAWTLQLGAELPRGAGSISQSELENLVRDFLHQKEHAGDVIKLFTGAVERVGALVSRVQGTLEFEVQPLREYFTGRFLYETAPYSPPGDEKGGTRTQRFDALARRPYWLNVTRFYAGCYNSGELASLVSGLELLGEAHSLPLTNHALQLATLFLTDWVFSQEPKTVRDIVAFITEDKNLRVLVSGRSSWEDNRLTLPEKSGRKEFVTRIQALFKAVTECDYLKRLGLLLRLNLSSEERWAFWVEHCRNLEDAYLRALALGLFLESKRERLEELLTEFGDRAALAAVDVGRWDILQTEQKIAAIRAIVAAAPDSAHFRHPGPVRSQPELYGLLLMLDPYTYRYLTYGGPSPAALSDALRRLGFPEDFGAGDETANSELHDVLTAAERASRLSMLEWQTSLKPWSDFVESIRRTWGSSPSTYALACVAAGIRSRNERATAFSDLLNETFPAVERARYARVNGTIKWWRDVLARASAGDLAWVLTVLFSWGSAGILKATQRIVAPKVDALDDDEWRKLVQTVQSVVVTTSRRPLSGFTEREFSAIKSERVRALLLLRLTRSQARDLLDRLLDEFDGDDIVLGTFLAERAYIEGYRDPSIWKRLIGYYKRFGVSVRSVSLSDEIPERFAYYPESNMSQEAASEVAANIELMPIKVIQAAELSLSAKSGLTSAPLARVAEEERWFV